ncbi:MAG: hypothetical protein GXP13_08170 [Gammaproteobacteria bacterium]|nr:hypothetical protein [Gammaproteobacteria bacterium]
MNMGGGELSGYYLHAFDNTVNGTGAGAGNANIGMSQNAFGVAYGKTF